jgi:cyanophycinase
MAGPLALVGGMAWSEGCDFDRDLLEASGTSEVVVLPTAAAYENPDKRVEAATKWFESLGATVRSVDVLGRPDAERSEIVDAVRSARFLYLSGGSPLHLRSVLKDTACWSALVDAWGDGAVLAGSSAGAMVLGDPMVDPRGGAYTLGLGLLPGLAVIPHANTWSHDKAKRTFELAQRDVTVVAIDDRTALLRGADGTWRAAGVGNVAAWRNGAEVALSDL